MYFLVFINIYFKYKDFRSDITRVKDFTAAERHPYTSMGLNVFFKPAGSPADPVLHHLGAQHQPAGWRSSSGHQPAGIDPGSPGVKA